MRTCLFLLVAALWNSFTSPLGAEIPVPRVYAVELSAQVVVSPPRITLQWRADAKATGYSISRRLNEASAWSNIGSAGGAGTNFVDTTVVVGTAYEYRVVKTTSDAYSGYGYILAGIELPPLWQRGRILLVVDNLHAGALVTELERLRKDLIGDGWKVSRADVSRSESPTAIRTRIASARTQNPDMKAVMLFGGIAVPYAGNIYPDGHANHRGAWPADVYYGDTDGTWTDSSVSTTVAERDINHNLPGDGKFDQSFPPSEVDLQVGRVDLSNLTCFSNKTPSRDELNLLRGYLNKNHRFRQRMFNVARRAIISDNFVNTGEDAVACTGWRNFSSFFGSQNVTAIAANEYFPLLDTQGYLCTFGSGGGQYYTVYGLGTSDNFALNDPQSVFNIYLGSYFGDWNNESNWIRASLGGKSYTLVAAYGGFPHLLMHPMALGENVGASIRRSQNNKALSGYNTNQGANQVHISMHGDPSLRLHAVAPPTNARVRVAGSGVRVTWNASSDTDLRGYAVFRSTSLDGTFTLLNPSLVTSNAWIDPTGNTNWAYMVRAVKLERSGSGTYLNPSQGAFTAVGTGEPPLPPLLPVTLGNPRKNGASFEFRINGVAQQKVAIDRSADGVAWTPIVTNVLSTSSDLWSETMQDRRFYRVRSVY